MRALSLEPQESSVGGLTLGVEPQVSRVGSRAQNVGLLKPEHPRSMSEHMGSHMRMGFERPSSGVKSLASKSGRQKSGVKIRASKVGRQKPGVESRA